ncbi:MAG: two pore domain potassium channel family protein [Clostridia bacterium]|nr:two pore domain potassium channel family protein [Clostridia bacterium]
MKKLRILKSVLKYTHADKIVIGFAVFVFISALIIMLFEPGINTYSDALWYCYAVITTIGFGDIIAVTFASRIISLLLSIYSIVVIAIATGVVVSYYNKTIQIKYNESKELILNKLENLHKLSKEELKELSDNVKKIR